VFQSNMRQKARAELHPTMSVQQHQGLDKNLKAVEGSSHARLALVEAHGSPSGLLHDACLYGSPRRRAGVYVSAIVK